MTSSSEFSLMAGIAKKVCILSSLAILVTHPAINTKNVLTYGDANVDDSLWVVDGENVERELLHLWAYGGLVNTSADPWFGRETDTRYLFAYESLAGPSPDLQIEDTGKVSDPAGEHAHAAAGYDSGFTYMLPGSDVKAVNVRDVSLSELMVTMRVPDFFTPAAKTMHAAGFREKDSRDYRVTFVADKDVGEAVTYYVAARQRLQWDDIQGLHLGDPDFSFGVLGLDGAPRPLSNIDGFVDGRTGTITWIVPRAELNVAGVPRSFRSEVDRGARVSDGDRIVDLRGRVSAMFLTNVMSHVSPVVATLNEVTEDGVFSIGSGLAGSTQKSSQNSIRRAGM